MSHVKIIMDGCKCTVYLLHCRVLPVLYLLKPMLELFLSFPPVVDKWIVRFSPTHLAVLCGREPLRELWAVSPHRGRLDDSSCSWKTYCWHAPPTTSLQKLQKISLMQHLRGDVLPISWILWLKGWIIAAWLNLNADKLTVCTIIITAQPYLNTT